MTDSIDSRAWDLPTAFGLDPELEAVGLNVAGVLGRGAYDACVPRAWQAERILPSTACVFVIGSGGSAFYHNARTLRRGSPHPLDETCETRVTAAARELGDAGFESCALFYWQRRGEGHGEFADFVGLARAAALGAPSLIGLLLHPRYGSWFGIRALLLTERPLPSRNELPAPRDFCATCAAPCIVACPADAVGRDAYDVKRCSESRHSDARCARRCAARLACPVGADFAYDDEALAYHTTARFRDA